MAAAALWVLRTIGVRHLFLNIAIYLTGLKEIE